MLNWCLNTIIKGNCVEEMAQFPDDSIDVIFADPPYNLQLRNALYRPNQKKFAGVNDEWDKFSSFEEYDNFTHAWLKECKRILKKDGSIWVIGSYHNIFRVGKIMQDLEFWMLNDIIWVKTNPVPNFRGTRFNNAHETLIWASKNDQSRYTFHYKSMKAFCDDKQMRSDWYIPICSGKERLKKDGVKVHSTQKPESLLFRVILSSSEMGDVVLDPFMGSGTTGAVAKKMKRNFIGIERNDFYIEMATKRIDATKPLPYESLTYPIEKKVPRVPFGALIEDGMINIGDFLFSKDSQYAARILADSTVKCGDSVGSIHKVSAQLINKQSNNGWMFWHIRNTEGNMVLIDSIRQQYIKEKWA